MTQLENRIGVEILKLPHGADIATPSYETQASAGMDLPAAIDQDLMLAPGERALVPTGFSIALPEGYEAQIRPRSGLAYKNGVTVLNSPGTVDADYRGEVKVLLINHAAEAFTITRGMRIAQMIIAPVTQAVWQDVSELSETVRGAGGFGSTGTEARSAN